MNKEDLLYHYFSNTLTEDQETEFNNMLKTDEAFRAQFEFENNLKRATKEHRRKDLKFKLEGFENDIITKSKKNHFYPLLKIAASVLILITAGWFGYQSFFGVNYNDMFHDNFETYPNTVYSISRSDTINSIKREAFLAYEFGKYQLAIKKLNLLKKEDYTIFYKAQALIALNKLDEAKILLQEVIDKDLSFSEESKWYLALIAIKQKDKQLASKYLQDLIENHKYKAEEAKILLKKLD